MNWYTPCRYQPDCAARKASAVAAPGASATSDPLRVLRRYSPCSLKLVRVAFPLGAHFHTPSTTHTRVLPVNALLMLLPPASSADSACSLAFAFSIDKPARQL